jgi:prepilin-type processing-associated H-X9-DG protein
MYSADSDDTYCMLQYYTALPPATTGCQKQTKWGDALYPYIKNGVGNLVGGSYDLNDGIFMSPSAAKQAAGSYALHQDVFHDGAAPWTGCNAPSDFRVYSQTTIDNLPNKVMMMERGNSGGAWAYLQFAAWQWDWGTWGYSPATNTVAGDSENDVNIVGGVFRGDCDGGFSGGSDPWAFCSMFPRYRYSSSTPFAYFDGHVKTMSRAARNGTARSSSQIDWVRNIYIPEAFRFGTPY